MPIYSDHSLVSKLLLNIIGNAVKFTPNGGSISFELIQTLTEPGWCNMEFIITDTGIGMSEEFLPRVFDDFEREKSSTISGENGVGLGLPIAKKIAEYFNGKIEIESKLNEGTKVKITLPQKLYEEADVKEQADNEVENSEEDILFGKRILLAEDNEFNAELTIELLEEKGALVEHAEDGRICVDMLNGADDDYYDLILMDIQMPNLDGFEATKEIRKLDNPKKAGIPIIALTANAFEEDKQKAFASGMDGFAAKPIDTSILFKEIMEKAK